MALWLSPSVSVYRRPANKDNLEKCGSSVVSGFSKFYVGAICNPGSRQNTSEGHTMYLFNIYEKPETYNIDSFDNYLRIRYNNLDKDYLIYSMELLNYKHRIYL